MSKKKIAGIIAGCIVAIIVIVVVATSTPTYTLSVNINPPEAGSVSPSGGEYESGLQITLTATPASDYTFDYWALAASGSSNTVTITMNSDKTIGAYFKVVEPSPTPDVLFSDDFSDESSGWFTYDTSYGRAIYRDGCLYVKDYTAQDAFMYGESQHYFTDFILGVETWLVDGTGDNWHLVLCRSKVESNYYAFGISADGYYYIGKWVNGDETPFITPTYSSYINQGVGAVNLIRIECIGSRLNLSVNGHLLDEVTDATFTGGDIALCANVISGTFTEVAFDNIIVTKATGPEEPEPAIPAQFSTYTDEQGLFSISYPPEWELGLEYIEELEQATEDIISSITSDFPLEEFSMIFIAGLPTIEGFDPNVTIVVESLPGIMWTHDNVVTAGIEGLKENYPDYHEFSRVKTTVGNRTATITEWQGTYPGFGTGRYLQMFLLVGKTVWGVCCSVFPDEYSEWEDDFDAIVRSLRILK